MEKVVEAVVLVMGVAGAGKTRLAGRLGGVHIEGDAVEELLFRLGDAQVGVE